VEIIHLSGRKWPRFIIEGNYCILDLDGMIFRFLKDKNKVLLIKDKYVLNILLNIIAAFFQSDNIVIFSFDSITNLLKDFVGPKRYKRLLYSFIFLIGLYENLKNKKVILISFRREISLLKYLTKFY